MASHLDVIQKETETEKDLVVQNGVTAEIQQTIVIAQGVTMVKQSARGRMGGILHVLITRTTSNGCPKPSVAPVAEGGLGVLQLFIVTIDPFIMAMIAEIVNKD